MSYYELDHLKTMLPRARGNPCFLLLCQRLYVFSRSWLRSMIAAASNRKYRMPISGGKDTCMHQ